MDPALEPVNRAPHNLELSAIVSRERFVSLFLERSDARFDRGLVDAHYLGAQRIPNALEMAMTSALVELCSPDGFMLNALGHFAKLSYGLVSAVQK